MIVSSSLFFRFWTFCVNKFLIKTYCRKVSYLNIVIGFKIIKSDLVLWRYWHYLSLELCDLRAIVNPCAGGVDLDVMRVDCPAHMHWIWTAFINHSMSSILRTHVACNAWLYPKWHWQGTIAEYPRVLPYGYFHMFAYYWVCAARDTPIFRPEKAEFPFRSMPIQLPYHFYRLPTIKKSVPEHHHFTFLAGVGCCRSGDHHFQNFFNFNPFIASHGRLSSNAKRSAAPRPGLAAGQSASQTRILAVPETRIFHAQNGSSSFRSPAFSSSKLVPEPRIFSRDRELVP